MGMYTEMYLGVTLEGLPDDLVKVFTWMTNPVGDNPPVPDHEFFTCDRWQGMFISTSYYFQADAVCSFFYDGISKNHRLTFRSDIKNYQDEHGKFLDLIEPYLDQDRSGHAGHTRYEEDLVPTLLFINNGKFVGFRTTADMVGMLEDCQK
jgi:hypothetical protein